MRRIAWIVCILVSLALLSSPTARLIRSVRMTRSAMGTFMTLVDSANDQDLDDVRSLCSRRYLESHAIERSPEGGVVGLPRNIHRNFQVWRQGNDVWLCPTNRVGPVYRMMLESESWKFDGLVGRLGSGGRVEVVEEVSAESSP